MVPSGFSRRFEMFAPGLLNRGVSVMLNASKRSWTARRHSTTRVAVAEWQFVDATDRLVAEKPGGVCQCKVKLTDANEGDAELVRWIRTAYDSAG